MRIGKKTKTIFLLAIKPNIKREFDLFKLFFSVWVLKRLAMCGIIQRKFKIFYKFLEKVRICWMGCGIK